MYSVIVILILLVCLLLAVAVLVQNSKGGGLAANFSAPNQIMGVRKTTETIEKITWGLAIALVVLSLAATIAIPRHAGEAEVSTAIDANAAKNAAIPAAQNAAPQPAAVPAAADAAAEAAAPEAK